MKNHLLSGIRRFTTVLLVWAVALPGWAQQRNMITVPAGTQLLVRMVDTVDSSKNTVGSRFTASLEVAGGRQSACLAALDWAH